MKKKKRRNWKRLSLACKDSMPCDCGRSVLCLHEDNEDLCEKALCPRWKKGEG